MHRAQMQTSLRDAWGTEASNAASIVTDVHQHAAPDVPGAAIAQSFAAPQSGQREVSRSTTTGPSHSPTA